MGSNYEKIFYKDYELLFREKNKLSKELRNAHYEYQLLFQRYTSAEQSKTALLDSNAQLKQLLQDSRREIERLKALVNTDGTNSGLPTSMTPIGKPKIVPNSREKTGNHRGGQKGHPKKKLERFKDEEVNETVKHTLEVCPECHNGLEKTGTIEKDVLDYKIIVEKTRHIFTVYYCPCCGKEIHQKIPNNLKEENQYGPQVQALALTLMNAGNVSINKTRKIIKGFTGGEIKLSEGYLAKLQQKAASGAEVFCEALRNEILQQNLVYWDDTAVMINTDRACLRYYGNEQLALYKAHLHKDKAGLDKDNILNLLPPATTVVHDHNKVNYNEGYSFQNAECNEHLLRDLKKVIDNLGSLWADELTALLTETNKERERKKEAGFKEFPPIYLSAFFDKFNDIMGDRCRNSVSCSIPFTNNLSERSLRDVKSKMKVAGQFQNEKTASYYANIRSYLETCNRNAVNGFYALHRLCTGDPLTLNEVLRSP